MKRLVTSASLVLAFSMFPGSALAKPPTGSHRTQYTRLYHQAQHRFGHRAPGRNIVRDGLTAGRAPTDSELVASIRVLERMLAPPAISARVSQITPGLTSGSTSGSCSGITPYSGGGQCWAIPYSIVSCESGGQNVPNTQGSGAMGYYQLMSGGTGSRASQDAAAAALYAGGAGASNWTCAG